MSVEELRSFYDRHYHDVLGAVTLVTGVPPADPALIDLRRALRGLPTRQREVVVLHYLLDLPVAEVADWLGLSPGGVKHALFRARRSLANALTIEEVSSP